LHHGGIHPVDTDRLSRLCKIGLSVAAGAGDGGSESAMNTTERGRISTLAILSVVGAAFLVYWLQIILLPFVISGLLAYICNPLMERLASTTRVSRSFFAIAVFVGLVLIASLVGFLALPPLLHQLTRAVTDFQGIMTNLARAAIGDGTVNFLGRSMNASQFAQAAVSAARDWIEQPGKMLELGKIAFSTMFGFLLTLVLLFYFLYSGPDVMRRLLWLVPPARRRLAFDIWARLDPVLRRYFVGVLAVVTYAATAAYIGLGVFLHLPHALFLAVLTGFLEMIPMVGPWASAVLAGIVAVQHATSIEAIIGYAVYAMALRLSIDQLFGPLVLGTAARLHPVAIIFCFLTGGVLFGVVGFILAVPVALVIKTCLAVLYGETSGQNVAISE
jgi:predicted PurR-regulated permease PerM